MSTPQSETVTSLPSAVVASWRRAIWVNLIEVVIFCTIPIIICPPDSYPPGTLQFIGWAFFGLFYQSFERMPGWIGDISPPVMTIVLAIVSIVFFVLNIALYFKAVKIKSSTPSPPKRIRRELRIALYVPFICWLFIATVSTITTYGFCGTGCEPFSGTTINIPVYLVVLLPWALRSRATKDAIQGLPGEQPIDEAWAAPVRKAILELGTKYTRLQINEIAERVNVKSNKQIVAVVEDMIKQKQIVAEYFKSSRSVAFDQQANTQALAKFITDLDGQFTAWGKESKKA